MHAAVPSITAINRKRVGGQKKNNFQNYTDVTFEVFSQHVSLFLHWYGSDILCVISEMLSEFLFDGSPPTWQC